jgi:signal transduction histidine kinase
MRQALWLSLLFLVTSSLSLGITYYVARDSQERAIEDTLVQDMVGFRATPSAAALAVLVNAQTSETDPQRRLLSYRRPGGRVVAGNASITQQSAGLRLMVLGADPIPVQGPFMLLSEQIHGGLLTLAQSAKPLQELRDTFLRVFLFSLLPTVAIALFGGVLLARRSARALSDLDLVLSRLTSGDLSARVKKPKGQRDDLGRIGDSVNRMAQAQEQSMVALKQVSADIAHDLKSPIQRVAVQLEHLHQIKDLPPQARSIAKEAVAETASIVETFQSLLQIAQLEGGSPRARFQPVDLGALARTFVEIYQPSAEEEGRQLTLTCTADPVLVAGDKALLGQLLANLVENALRHTPKSSDINLTLAAGPQPVLTVRDHGPGIIEAEQQNVLRRLYRLEQSRTTPGSGLGLSLVQAIADLHGAEISLSNAHPGLRVSVLFSNAPYPAK